jgi:hypothetical protein
VLAQAVLVVLAIYTLAVQAHRGQEHLLAVAVAVQVWLALAQTHLLTMAATAVQVVAVGAVLLLVALLAQAVTALFIFTTKEC